jgi:long-chain fatty acid transport protein
VPVRVRRFFFALLAAASAARAAPAFATPSALFSLGTESQALGKTGIAGVSDLGAVVLNPAALAGSPGKRLWLGYDAALFSPTVQGYSGAPPAQPGFAGGVLGLRLPIGSSASPPALTLGLAITSPRDVIVRAALPLAETPQFPLLSARAQALDLGLSLGARLSEQWFVGLGLRGLAGLQGEVEVPAENARGGVENELSLELAPIVGVLVRGRHQAVGIVYRGALAAPFEVELRDQSLPGISLPPLHLDGLAHYDPAELGLEWSRELGRTRVAVGVVYQRWSAFDGWLGRTVRCPESDPGCEALPAERVALSDTLSPRLGLSRRVELPGVELTLRLGYAFEPTPLPEQTALSNRWDNDRSLFTFGYGVNLSQAELGLGVVYQLHVLHERTHAKDAPELTPELSQVTVGGRVHFVGIDAELRF